MPVPLAFSGWRLSMGPHGVIVSTPIKSIWTTSVEKTTGLNTWSVRTFHALLCSRKCWTSTKLVCWQSDVTVQVRNHKHMTVFIVKNYLLTFSNNVQCTGCHSSELWVLNVHLFDHRVLKYVHLYLLQCVRGKCIRFSLPSNSNWMIPSNISTPKGKSLDPPF